MVTIDDDRDPTPDELRWWDSGGHPPYKRVWRDGVDVTDEDPSTWPALWNPQLPAVTTQRSGRTRRR
jgi:hypothetical protein